ncbi:MAG TPA: hypothetical protein ENJ23_01555 [Bacteroidetes bacterium]|nr:hypothetical protein [Bacteroidota bacterium]
MGTSDHRQSFVLFCRYLEEDVEAPLCRELKAHLEVCPECRAHLLTVKKTIELYRRAQPSAKLSPEAKKKLLEKIIGPARSRSV